MEGLNGGPKGTEILRIASPGLDLRRHGEAEKAPRADVGAIPLLILLWTRFCCYSAPYSAI